MESLENNQNIQKHVEFVFYRVPKKNHEALLSLTNRLIDLFKKEEVIYDCFGLNNAKEIPGFVNITKIIPINTEEEEILINVVTYKGREHRTKVVEKISKDKECLDMYEDLMKLLTPGTRFINGEFKNLFNK